MIVQHVGHHLGIGLGRLIGPRQVLQRLGHRLRRGPADLHGVAENALAAFLRRQLFRDRFYGGFRYGGNSVVIDDPGIGDRRADGNRAATGLAHRQHRLPVEPEMRQPVLFEKLINFLRLEIGQLGERHRWSAGA